MLFSGSPSANPQGSSSATDVLQSRITLFPTGWVPPSLDRRFWNFFPAASHSLGRTSPLCLCSPTLKSSRFTQRSGNAHFFFLFFLGPYPRHMEVPRLRVESELHLLAYTHPQQQWIWAVSSTYTTAHGNARFLTHWLRPGIEPASSWILARFVNHWATMGPPGYTYFILLCWPALLFFLSKSASGPLPHRNKPRLLRLHPTPFLLWAAALTSSFLLHSLVMIGNYLEYTLGLWHLHFCISFSDKYTQDKIPVLQEKIEKTVCQGL